MMTSLAREDAWEPAGDATEWAVPTWPIFGVEPDVRPALARARAAGRPAVLGTLYAHEGPTPLGEGAQILFDRGAAAGFLSGGCVESDVAVHARDVFESGEPRRLVYGRGGPPDIELLCGSRIEVMLERVAPDDTAARELLDLGAARRPALWLSDGTTRACLPADAPTSAAPPPLRSLLALATSQSAEAGGLAGTVFRRHAPRSRFVVVGGDPICLTVARLAVEAGFEVSLVRPRGPEAPPPVAGARYFRDTAAAAFDALGLDAWTAVAIATHDIEIDHEGLKAALLGEAGYVGALGSRRRIPLRLARLAADGVPQAAIDRLHAPIGLPIGARSPWEIAVSIVAEVVQSLKAPVSAAAAPPAPSSFDAVA